MPSHINTEIFRKKSIEKHEEKYDYSQSNYIKSSILVFNLDIFVSLSSGFLLFN